MAQDNDALARHIADMHGRPWSDCGAYERQAFKDAAATGTDYPASQQAVEEGWCIIWSDTRGWEIQRDDEQKIFATDDDAQAYVEAQAAQGSAYHRQALDFVTERP